MFTRIVLRVALVALNRPMNTKYPTLKIISPGRAPKGARSTNRIWVVSGGSYHFAVIGFAGSFKVYIGDIRGKRVNATFLKQDALPLEIKALNAAFDFCLSYIALQSEKAAKTLP